MLSIAFSACQTSGYVVLSFYGGVMGKMVAPQSVVVASTATGIYGSEGSILRFVFIHSFILACLMGVLVSLLVYFPALTKLILG